MQTEAICKLQRKTWIMKQKKRCFTLIGTPLRVNKKPFAGNVKYFNDFLEKKSMNFCRHYYELGAGVYTWSVHFAFCTTTFFSSGRKFLFRVDDNEDSKQTARRGEKHRHNLISQQINIFINLKTIFQKRHVVPNPEGLLYVDFRSGRQEQ